MKNIFTLLGLCSLPFLSFSQAPDPSFGAAGFVITDIQNQEEDPNRVIVQPDGKILVTGDVSNGSSESFMLLRYNADGSPDQTFGTNGQVTLSLPPEHHGRDLVVLSSGQLMVLGRLTDASTGKLAPALMLFNQDGSLDSSFATNGIAAQPFENEDIYLSNLHRQPDGKYLLTGRTGDIGSADIALARLNDDGTADNSFGNQGYTTYDVFGNFDIISKSLLLSTGEVIGAGWSFNPGIGDDQLVVTKFQGNGSIDPSFGTNGVVTLPSSGGQDTYRAVAAYGSSHFLAAGYMESNNHSDLLVSRFDLNGNIDSTFGVNGHVSLDYKGNDDRARSGLHVLSNGRILVGANVEDLGGDENIALLILDDQGNIDSSFGDQGWYVQHYQCDDLAEDMQMQPDGKVLMVGTTNDGSAQQDLLLLRVDTGATIGLEEERFLKEPILMPNPVMEWLTVEGLPGKTSEMRIYKSDGRLVEKLSIAERPARINLGHLPAGIYFIMMEGKAERILKIDHY